jgi:2'-5' RNA ligase
MSSIRAFIAVAIPPAIRAQLAAVQAALRAAGADVGWVRPEGIHVTVKFLGEVAVARCAAIEEALNRAVAGQAPFVLHLGGVGVFPSARAPRIIWAGVTVGAEPLTALAAAIAAAMVPLGFAPESRPYRPHLTLGRVKSPQGGESLRAELAQCAPCAFGTVPVTECGLYRSELTPQGASYTRLSTARLGGG